MSNFPFQIGELLEVKIEKLSFGGSGIARFSGVVIFIPFSAPGDLLQIKITQIKKRHAEGEILKLIDAGPDRATPPCVAYGHCGGCNWQHLSYESQLRFKQEIVTDFLNKFISSSPTTKILPIVPSTKPFHYRNRAQLKFKDNLLGFFKKNTHDVVDIEACWLLEEGLSEKIPSLKIDLIRQKLAKSELKSVELSLFSETPDLSEEGFSQVNRFQNENLIQAVLSALSATPKDEGSPSTLFDLYAGSGNFTFPLIKIAGKRRVVGVELHSGAAKLAQDKLKKLKLSPKLTEFYNADVEIFLRRFPISAKDIVLLDPPRVGCSEEVISILAKSAPHRILYISCDPASLARDLDRLWLKSEGKYHLHQVQCFDMFPQTHHVETLVEISTTQSLN